MLRSLKVFSLCLLFCIAVFDVGCAMRPSALRTRSWVTPCDTCTCIMEPCDTCNNGDTCLKCDTCIKSDMCIKGNTCIKGVENFAKVTPALWRGAQPTREGFRNLKIAGVKTIVNLRYDHDDLPDLLLLADTQLKYYWIKTHAWNPEEEDIVKFLKVLEDKNNWPVFVHCFAGKDRTGYAIAAYRIIEEHWTTDDAIHEMFDFGFHPYFFLNPDFLRNKIEKGKEDIRKRVKEEQAPIPVFVNTQERTSQK